MLDTGDFGRDGFLVVVGWLLVILQSEWEWEDHSTSNIVKYFSTCPQLDCDRIVGVLWY